ncbi:MAG: carboxypeptidase, partial [Vulcanococcus sp.]
MTKRRRRPLLTAGLIGAGAGITVALSQALLSQAVDALLPNVRRLNSYNRPGTITVLAADGQVIQKLGPATREKLISGQMPLLVERAFIAAEDRRFYEHDGI